MQRETRAVEESPSVPTRRVVEAHFVERLRPSLRRLQRTAGNQATARMAHRGSRLVVGAADDHFEHQADSVADQVVRALQHTSGTGTDTEGADNPEVAQSGGVPTTDLHRVQRSSDAVVGRDGGAVDVEFEQALGAARGGGAPLPEQARRSMEGAFGADFSAVRVHEGSRSTDLNESISAKAFTVGSDVFFRDGVPDTTSAPGQKLLAHELTHTLQQGGTASRKTDVHRAISASAILSALDSIDFIKQKYDQQIHGEKMLDHIVKALDEYETMFGGASDAKHEAVMMSMALNAVARVIAEELFDPDIQPRLAAKLLELYRTEIEGVVGKGRRKREKAQTSKALDLAAVLVSDDPVSLYMHNEARLDKASRRIMAMSRFAGMKAKPGMTPTEVFDALSERFQAEMAAYTRTKLTAAEDKRESYNIKESTGEVSPRWFTELFGDQDTATKKTVGTGVEFTNASAAKLKALGDEVARLEAGAADAKVPTDRGSGPVKGAAVRGGVPLTDRQEQHLSELEGAEALTGAGSLEGDIVNTFMRLFSMDESKARSTLGVVKNWLATVPITITVDAADWFGKEKAPSTKEGTTAFKPATAWTHLMDVSTLFKKPDAQGTVEYRGKYEHPKYAKERGENYLRFRAWKDRVMTSLLDFTPAEMPVFGAANVNWEQTKGSEGLDSYGQNYYGDMHFLAKDDVRSRMIFTATDHGAPRRDPMFALHDFCVGGSITGLKDVKRDGMVTQIVSAATSTRAIGANLPFEVQIFGGIDIAKDVSRVFVKNSAATKTVVKNLKAFTKKTKVPHEILSATPAGVTAVTKVREAERSIGEGELSPTDHGKLEPDYSLVRPVQINAMRALQIDVKTPKDKQLVLKLIADVRNADLHDVGDQTRALPYVQAMDALEITVTAMNV